MSSSRKARWMSATLLVAAWACGKVARDTDTRPQAGPGGSAPEATHSGMTREEHDRIPPGPPGSVVVEQRSGAFVVSWAGTRDDTIQGYVVYRRCAGEEWVEVQRVPLHAEDGRNRGQYSFEERWHTTCEYAVAALDARGRPGLKSTEVH